jgi:hypothetical protein
MDWISVKDKMPDRYEFVLVLTRQSGYKPIVNIGYYNGSQCLPCWDYWKVLTEELMYVPENEIVITHWMPFPEPPDKL